MWICECLLYYSKCFLFQFLKTQLKIYFHYKGKTYFNFNHKHLSLTVGTNDIQGCTCHGNCPVHCRKFTASLALPAGSPPIVMTLPYVPWGWGRNKIVPKWELLL